MAREWLKACLLVAPIAAVACLPRWLDTVKGQIQLGPWLGEVLATMVACLALYHWWRARDTVSPTVALLAAAGCAAMLPAAVQPKAIGELASAAGVACLAVSFCLEPGRSAYRSAFSALWAALACASIPAAAAWPASWAWASLRAREPSSRGGWMMSAGLLGLVVWGLLPGGQQFGSRPGSYDIARQLQLFLPGLMLGWAGLLSESQVDGHGRLRGQRATILRYWAALCGAGLLAALVGLPVDLRACVLPFLWWVPAGLAEAARVLRDRDPEARLVRRTALLALGLMAVMLVPAAERLKEGLLTALYVCLPS